MGVLDWLFNRDKSNEGIEATRRTLEERLRMQAEEMADVKALLRSQTEQANKLQNYLRVSRSNIPKPIQFSTKNLQGGGDKRNMASYEGPLYDLQEISRALDVEAYIATSIRKHREQILKEGYRIAGSDQEAVDYINERLFEFYLVSGVPFDEVLREFTTNLIQYATAFIVKVRDPKASSGSRYRWRASDHDPIAAIFPMDPTNVSAQQNSLGHVTRWQQRITDPQANQNSIKKYKSNDIVVATIDKKSGFVFGTPYILPVLDDVRTLRRIEEVTEVLVQRHAFPWVHWKVGSDEFPAMDLEDGTSEVDIVKNVIQATPPEGGVVTDWRVHAEVLGMQGQAINLEPYLKYFEERVMAGLRLSPGDIGRSGGAKADAIAISETLQDASKDFQDVLSKAITHQLFVPLLLEGGFDVTRESMVHLEFQLINRAEERARVSHGADLWTLGTITRTEFRKEYLNKHELSAQELEEVRLELGHKHEVELANIAATKALTASPGSGNTTLKKSSNTVRPENQSGKKPAKTRVVANDIYSDFYQDFVEQIWNETKQMLSSYIDRAFIPIEDDGSDPCDITTREIELKSILDRLTAFVSKDSKSLLLPLIQAGVRKASLDAKLDKYDLGNRAIDRFIKNNITKYLKVFTSSLENEINSNEYFSGIKQDIHPQIILAGIFENRDRELFDNIYKQINLSYRFGYAKAAKSYGHKSFVLTPVEGYCCDECMSGSSKVVYMLQKDIPYNILLATHSNCEFDINLNIDKTDQAETPIA